MIKQTILSLSALFIASSASAQIRGHVYYDTNSNGIFDRGDRPISDVRVSDGKNIVSTDRSGAFTLQGHKLQKFVFVTTPSGLNAKHYQLITPDKDSDYDFAMRPTSAKIGKNGEHAFLHITDTEISGANGHEKWVDGIRNYAADQKAAFVIHTGDICYEKGLNAHIKLMNDQNMGLPVRYCIGNHDYVKGAYGEELFEKNYGPIYYSFDAGKTHYVVTPMPYGDHKPGFSHELFLEWLQNDLSQMRKGQSLVIFNHDLVCRDSTFKWGDVELLNHNLRGWIYGHWHINHVKKIGDIPTICSSADKGGIDHSAATFRRIDVNANGDVNSQLIYPYIGNSLTVAECRAENDATTLSVNAYNTSSPITSVTANYLVAGKHTTTKLNASTDWNWRAKLPANASQIKISALCNNGQKLIANASTVADTALTMAWSVNAGSNIYLSSPITDGKNIYLGCVDEALSGKAGVACFDAQTGTRRWFYNTRNSIKNSIATADGKVFAQDAEGFLYAINAQTGAQLWSQKLTVADPLPSVIEGLAVHNGKLYAGTGRGLTALNYDGSVIWRNNDWSQNEGTTSTFAFTDSMILTGSQWQALFANNLTTGKMVWRADRDGLRFRASTPLIANGVAYVLSQNSLFILDPRTGNIIMRKELPYDVQITSQPLLTEDAIIFGTTNAGIRALDVRTFEPLWDVATGAGLIYTSPYQRDPVQNIESSGVLTSGGHVIIGTADGVIRVIDPKTGSVEARAEVGAPILTTFLVNGKACYVADYAGNLYRFNTDL